MTVDKNLLQQLNQQIVQVRERVRRKQDLERKLSRARQSLREQQARLWRLEERLAEAGADVEMLETLSLHRLFVTFLGKRQEQLETRRQELLTTELRHQECREAVAALQQEIADLEQRLGELDHVEKQYQALLEQKERQLPLVGGAAAEKALGLAEAEADTQSALQELQEAINAGSSILSNLDRAISALEGARNWGKADLLGGGLVTTAAKHSRVDEARRWVHQAQQGLRRLRRELADLEAGGDVNIEIGPFATFADYFFDGLVADWVVQERINNSLNRAVQMRRHVQTTVDTLQRGRARVARRMEQIKEEKDELIEPA